jgi:hypothetical protein
MIQGLRYDDLYDPYFDLDIKEALARLPQEVVDARIQRLKRAMDLSMKHQYLPDDLQVRPFLPPPALIWTDPFRFAYGILILPDRFWSLSTSHAIEVVSLVLYG